MSTTEERQLLSRRTALKALAATGALAFGLIAGARSYHDENASTSIIVSRFHDGYVLYGTSLDGRPVSVFVPSSHPLTIEHYSAVLMASEFYLPVAVEIVEVSNSLVNHLALANSARHVIEIF